MQAACRQVPTCTCHVCSSNTCMDISNYGSNICVLRSKHEKKPVCPEIRLRTCAPTTVNHELAAMHEIMKKRNASPLLISEGNNDLMWALTLFKSGCHRAILPYSHQSKGYAHTNANLREHGATIDSMLLRITPFIFWMHCSASGYFSAEAYFYGRMTDKTATHWQNV